MAASCGELAIWNFRHKNQFFSNISKIFHSGKFCAQLVNKKEKLSSNKKNIHFWPIDLSDAYIIRLISRIGPIFFFEFGQKIWTLKLLEIVQNILKTSCCKKSYICQISIFHQKFGRKFRLFPRKSGIEGIKMILPEFLPGSPDYYDFTVFCHIHVQLEIQGAEVTLRKERYLHRLSQNFKHWGIHKRRRCENTFSSKCFHH